MSRTDPVTSDLLRGREIPDAVLADLPKVDLHVHLDGSLRLGTFIELCRQHGIALPGPGEEAVREAFTHERSDSLDDYLALFKQTVAVLQSETALRRAARELVEDCAAENARHVEIRFSPMLHAEGDLEPAGATDAVLAGIAEGREGTGISAGLILAGVRHREAQESVRLAELAVAYKGRGVIGFDLAGAEAKNPAKRFTRAFQHILNHNINCTVHAGEAWGPESIHQALHYLNAHRVSHATRLLEDAELAGFVADHRIPIEVGLSSSRRTHSVPADGIHPLRHFLERGIRVTLTTNNRLFLDTDMTRELRTAADTFDFTLLDIENLLLAGFKSAFLPQRERVDLIHRAIDEFGDVRRRHGLETTE